MSRARPGIRPMRCSRGPGILGHGRFVACRATQGKLEPAELGVIEVVDKPESTIMKPSVGGSLAGAARRGALPFSRFEMIVGTAAIVAAAVALWLTLRADFLAHPGWLALQKADLILGPVFTGLYWRRRRPGSRFGPLLVAVGLLSTPYLLQSSATPWAFSL